MSDFVCTKCHVPQDVSQRCRGGDRATWCKSCWRAYSAEWREANRRRVRDGLLRKKYGITIDQYEAMFSEQGGLCAICRQPETSLANNGNEVKLLAVDHDHDTGVVRGLLCHDCNVGIGHLTEPTVLLAAADYLLLHQNESATAIT